MMTDPTIGDLSLEAGKVNDSNKNRIFSRDSYIRAGRPGRPRAERRVHWRRSHRRCHRTTVSGCTTIKAVRQSRQALASSIQKQSISVAELGASRCA